MLLQATPFGILEPFLAWTYHQIFPWLLKLAGLQGREQHAGLGAVELLQIPVAPFRFATE